jgi:dolichol-phosphate mannosyltransferase
MTGGSAAAVTMPTTATPDISVIVMAYNEVASLGSVVSEIDCAFAETSWEHETIIVDDGSTDGTGRVADELAPSTANAVVVHHPRNLGIGEVYRSGFTAARGRYVTFLPADAQFPATIVTDFAARMGNADLVLGYLPERRRSPLARALSGGERLLYSLMFGKLPRFQGIMMFRRELPSDLRVTLGGRGWGVLMEIIVRAKRRGLRIESVPTPIRPRQSGHSKVTNLRSVVANLRQAGRLWWALRTSP